jgi:hypothetical protein
MALNNTTNNQSFIAFSGQKDFNFTIPFFELSDIVVQKETASTGILSTLTYKTVPTSSTEYKVVSTNGDSSSGGTVTIGGNGSLGNDKYIVSRVVPITQEYDLQDGSSIDSTALNKAFDRAVAQNQQQQDEMKRQLQFPATDSDSITYTVDSASRRANKALGFDASGNITELDLLTTGTVTGNTLKGISIDGNQISAKTDNDSIEFDALGNISLRDNGINENKIKSNAITQAKMADNSVGTSELINNSVTLSKIDTIGNKVLIGNMSGATATPSSVSVEQDIFTVTDANTISTAQAVRDYVDTRITRPIFDYVDNTSYTGSTPANTESTDKLIVNIQTSASATYTTEWDIPSFVIPYSLDHKSISGFYIRVHYTMLGSNSTSSNKTTGMVEYKIPDISAATLGGYQSIFERQFDVHDKYPRFDSEDLIFVPTNPNQEKFNLKFTVSNASNVGYFQLATRIIGMEVQVPYKNLGI